MIISVAKGAIANAALYVRALARVADAEGFHETNFA